MAAEGQDGAVRRGVKEEEMKNLRIGKKLLITFMLIILLFIGTVAIAITALNENSEKYSDFYNVGYQITNKVMSMWGCRVVVGYVLGIMLGWGVVGVWMGMFADWAVRAVLFYWRMVTGRWLWKYPRSEPQKCEKKPAVPE